VGGTTLRLNTLGDYGSESAWARAGSGCSKYEAKRAWQTDGGCTHKSVADVSAVSNPNTGAAIYDSVPYAGYVGWFKAGGTSLAAPIIAGIYALSGNTSGNASAIPYAHRGQLHDITTGANGACTSYFCQARVGYDGPTGLGTPNGVGAF
jgi:subtilase family serine protease